VNYLVKVRPGGRTETNVGFSPAAFHRIQSVPAQPSKPINKDKVDPILSLLVRKHAPSEPLDVLITFHDQLRIPVLPKLRDDEPQDSTASAAVMTARQNLIDSIISQRADVNSVRLPLLEREHRLQLVQAFWLADTWHARVPADQIALIASRPEVTYVQAALEPGNKPPSLPVSSGRARLASDWLYTRSYFFDQSYIHVGIIDTGVYKEHIQLQARQGDSMSPAFPPGSWQSCQQPRYDRPPIDLRVDCLNGSTDFCDAGSPNIGDTYGHGTSTAAIITANSSQPFQNGSGGDDYHGASKCTVKSFKVYDSNGSLIPVAVERAFHHAVISGVDIIVVEVQSPTPYDDALAAAANGAFDSGCAVLAANGNTDAVSTVASPANAHKVLGIGAIDAQNGTQFGLQANGPTQDGRIKPDIQLPTSVATATIGSPSEITTSFSGTSCAAAFAGAAAGEMTRWNCDYCNRCTNFSAGGLYAALIAHSTQAYPFNNTSGAGPLVLPTYYGDANFGSVYVNATQAAEVDFDMTTNQFTDLSGAIWWPETPESGHSWIKIDLIDPNGVTRASSSDPNSVFQSAKFAGPVSGIWKMMITPISLAGYDQIVYFGGFRRCDNC
jgi:hypothetical protein